MYKLVLTERTNVSDPPPGVGGCLAAIRGKDKMLTLVEIAAEGGEKKIRYFRSVSARLQCFQTPRNDKLSGSDNN